MTPIKIDNVDYDTDKLSDDAKAQLVSLQFCDHRSLAVGLKDQK